MERGRKARRTMRLRVDANLKLRSGRHRATLTGRGSRLRFTTQGLFGALGFYRALPAQVGGAGKGKYLGQLHRLLRDEGISLQVCAGSISLGRIGAIGSAGRKGLLGLLIR